MSRKINSRIYDHIIIGAGIVGSWTGLHLAKAGRSVLLIEQFSLPHSRGSSHGQTRIFRICDSDANLARLAWASKSDWLKLEKEAGGAGALWHKSGRLMTRPLDQMQWIDDAQRVMEDLKVPFSRMSDSEMSSKFPSMTWDEFEGIYEPDSAILYSDKCLSAVQRAFVEHGGKLLDRTRVTFIEPGKTTDIQIQDQEEPINAKSLILTCGPWNKGFLDSLKIDLPLHAEAIAVCYWKIIQQGVYDLKNGFPNFGSKIDTVRWYGLPALEYPDMMKVCIHGGHKCDPEERDRIDVSESIESLSRYLSDHFPLVDSSAPAIVEKCLYTMTPDELFVYDRHPEHENIVFGAGFCGGGFKVSPCSGRILAHLATGDPSFLDPVKPLDLGYFGAARFANRKFESRDNFYWKKRLNDLGKIGIGN